HSPALSHQVNHESRIHAKTRGTFAWTESGYARYSLLRNGRRFRRARREIRFVDSGCPEFDRQARQSRARHTGHRLGNKLSASNWRSHEYPAKAYGRVARRSPPVTVRLRRMPARKCAKPCVTLLVLVVRQALQLRLVWVARRRRVRRPKDPRREPRGARVP